MSPKKTRNFLKNVQYHIDKIETQKKNEELGKVINSLQRPFTEVLQAVILKQIKDVDELITNLKWEKKF